MYTNLVKCKKNRYPCKKNMLRFERVYLDNNKLQQITIRNCASSRLKFNKRRRSIFMPKWISDY